MKKNFSASVALLAAVTLAACSIIIHPLLLNLQKARLLLAQLKSLQNQAVKKVTQAAQALRQVPI